MKTVRDSVRPMFASCRVIRQKESAVVRSHRFTTLLRRVLVLRLRESGAWRGSFVSCFALIGLRPHGPALWGCCFVAQTEWLHAKAS